MVGIDGIKDFANQNSDQINQHVDSAQEQHGDKLGQHADKVNQGVDAAQGRFLNGDVQEQAEGQTRCGQQA